MRCYGGGPLVSKLAKRLSNALDVVEVQTEKSTAALGTKRPKGLGNVRRRRSVMVGSFVVAERFPRWMVKYQPASVLVDPP